MRALTPRQQQILDLIAEHVDTTGFPPTRAEIAGRLGFRSANAAEDHLKALARKGAIELTSGASRGIRLIGAAARTALPAELPGAWSVPLIGRVSAGRPILSEQHVQTRYSLDPALFPTAPDYLLKVRGLSMKDAGILDGDLLAVHGTPEARSGQIVVARLGDEVTVKRLHRTSHGQIRLLAENPDFQPITVDGTEPFSIEGIGVGIIRTASFS